MLITCRSRVGTDYGFLPLVLVVVVVLVVAVTVETKSMRYVQLSKAVAKIVLRHSLGQYAVQHWRLYGSSDQGKWKSLA